MDIEPNKLKASAVFADYSSDLHDVDRRRKQQLSNHYARGDAIVLDIGTDTVKAAYATSSVPAEAVFKPLVSKSKEAIAQSFNNSINFAYEQIDIVKNDKRTPFERNILMHQSILEHCCDFAFNGLGCSGSSISCPILITEAAANPVYCRQQFAQLFFECYGVNELFVGIDGLFAFFYEQGCDLAAYQQQNAIIINLGGATTHVIPFVKGAPQFESIKRLNYGVNNSFQLMAKSLLLKNPELRETLNMPVLKHLFNKYAQVAYDYSQQLKYFQKVCITTNKHKDTSKDSTQCTLRAYKNKIQWENSLVEEQPHRMVQPIQIQFESISAQMSQQELARKQDARKRMAERLKQALQKKKEIKQKQNMEEYQQLVALRQKLKEDPEANRDTLVQMFGENKPQTTLRRKIKTLQAKLGIESEEPGEKKYALLDIPDNELPPEKLKLKRLQIYQKAAVEARRKKLLEQQEEQRRLRQMREDNPKQYMAELQKRHDELSARLKEKDRIRSELANRNSRLNQKRMQTLAQLQDDDDFAEEDPDLGVYKTLEEEDRKSEMEAIELELRELDPDWVLDTDRHHLHTGSSLFIATDLIRGPEVFFQPSLIGVDQLSLPETISLVLRGYTAEQQQKLLSNIWLVGGGSKLKGLKQRLHKELTSLCSVGSHIELKVASQSQLGCVLGMKGLAAKYPEYVRLNSIKKRDYVNGLASYKHLFNDIQF